MRSEHIEVGIGMEKGYWLLATDVIAIARLVLYGVSRSMMLYKAVARAPSCNSTPSTSTGRCLRIEYSVQLTINWRLGWVRSCYALSKNSYKHESEFPPFDSADGTQHSLILSRSQVMKPKSVLYTLRLEMHALGKEGKETLL